MSNQDRTRKTSNIVKRVDDLEDALQEYNAPVTSVNEKTGDVVLNAADVGALPDDTEIPVLPDKIVNTVNGEDGDVVITPESIGALPDDTDIPVVDYPVTSVNTKTGDVVLNAADVGALPDDTVIPVLPEKIVNTVNGEDGDVVITPESIGALPDDTDIPVVDYPVTSVNSKTGDVVLNAADVGALPDDTVIPVLPEKIVNTVNGEDGDVVITPESIGALPDDTDIPVVDYPVTSVNSKTGDVVLSVEDLEDVVLTTKTSGQVLRFDGTNWVNSEEEVQEIHSSDGSINVTNEGNGRWDLIVVSDGNGDGGPGTGKTYALSGQDGVIVELDPASNETLTKWIAKADKSWLDARYLGIDTDIPVVDYPVTSVNGKTGDVVLNAADVGALPDDTEIPDISDISLPISSVDETVTIDGEGNKVSVYGNSGLPDITPVTLEIKTTTDGSGWSTEDAWGKLSFWNDDGSAGGAKQHAFIDCVAHTDTGGQSNMRFGLRENTWMTMKAGGLINFTPQQGNTQPPTKGDLYYDSRYELFRYWDGEQWRDINPSGSGDGYFFNSRGDAVCPGAGINDDSPVIPVNIGTKYATNDYMLNDGAIYTITLGTTSTGSVASSKYVVRKVDGVFTAEIMSSNDLVSNVPIVSVRPTTQIDPATGDPYEGRYELVLWDNHVGSYNHTWCVEGMFTGSVQQQFSVNNAFYTIGPAVFQSDTTSYVCLDAINSKDQADQDVAWNYSSGSFVGRWGDPGDVGTNRRVEFNTWNSNAVNAMGPRPDGTYGRWYERPRVGMRLNNAVTNTKFESETNAYDGTFYSNKGDPATWQGGLIQAVEWDGEGTNAENVTKIRMSARDKNEKDMCHSRTYVSPAYLEDSKNISGNDWMQIHITQDDDSRKNAAYMVTSGEYVSPSADDPTDSQPYYEYGVKWYGSGSSAGTDFNGGKDGVAYQIQFFRNMTGMVISENGNTQLTRLSLDFNHADGQFYRDCTARISGERQGTTGEIRLCGYSQINATIGLHKNYECGYYGFNVYAEQEPALKVTKTDIQVNENYQPTGDNSLVTKGWVTANGGGGTLPISSSDNKVTLSDDDGTFQIETGDPTADPSTKAVRVKVSDHVVIVGSTSTPIRMSSTNDSCLIRYQGAANNGWFAGSSGVTFAIAGGANGNNQLIITPDDNVKIPTEIRTDTITTKDAAVGDPADGKNDGDKVIRLKGNQVQITDQDSNPGTGGYSLDIRDNRGMFRLRNDDVVNGINDTATIALDVSNNNYNTSIEFRTGNVKRAEIVKQNIAGNQYWAQYCANGSASGLEFRTAWGQVTEKTFETHPARTIISTFEQNNDPNSDNYRGIENYVDRLTITNDDIQASAGYEPQTDNSLATKKYTDSRIWKGTQAEYDALGTYDDSVLYCITS